MRYLKGLVAIGAIALVVAACAPQEPEFYFDPQLNTGLGLFTAPDLTWDVGDGYHVDLTGIGMGNDGAVTNNDVMLDLTGFDNIQKVRVQVQIKGGPVDDPYWQPSMVVFTSSTGEMVTVDSAASGPGDLKGYYETNFGWHYNAWLEDDDPDWVKATVYVNGAIASTANCDNPATSSDDEQCTPRAFNAWVFRTPDATDPANSGGLFHHDV